MTRLLQALIGSLLLLFLTAGCATTQRAKSADTLQIVGETVNAAMNVYGELYRAGKIHPEDEARIDRMHAKYQALYAAAVKAVAYDYQVVAPAEIALIASQLVAAIEAL